MRTPLRSKLIAALLTCAAAMVAGQEITPSQPAGPPTQQTSGFAAWLSRLFTPRQNEPVAGAGPAASVPAASTAPSQTVTVIAPPAPIDPNAWPTMPPNGTDLATLEVRLMDANGDGYISHDEFAQEYERLFRSLPKNDQGLVSVKDLVAARSAALKAAAATFNGR